MAQPAKNKWTKMDPAFQAATIMMWFFSSVMAALESKAQITYEVLTASGQDVDEPAQDDEDPEGENKKQRTMRFTKRSLAFVGDVVAKWLLLIWVAVGQSIMKVHYRLFKHVEWCSHRAPEDYESLTALDFCPGFPQARNPAFKAVFTIIILIVIIITIIMILN